MRGTSEVFPHSVSRSQNYSVRGMPEEQTEAARSLMGDVPERSDAIMSQDALAALARNPHIEDRTRKTFHFIEF